MSAPDYAEQWGRRAAALLVGRRITAVSYLSHDEAAEMDWHARSLAIELDSGMVIFASRDDEGNGPGALFTTAEDLPTIPVIP